MVRVRARISWHFGASAGQADARRRDAGDVVTSSRSGNAADACPPPRPAGLRLPRPANYCGLPVMIQLGMGAAAKCQIILARAFGISNAGEHAVIAYSVSNARRWSIVGLLFLASLINYF